MPTPLDQLFEKIGENPPDSLSDVARTELAEFSALLDATIPPKRTVTSNLLIATWNIAHFASLQKRWQVPAQSSLSPKRDYRCLMIIAEIISRFDVVKRLCIMAGGWFDHFCVIYETASFVEIYIPQKNTSYHITSSFIKLLWSRSTITIPNQCESNLVLCDSFLYSYPTS